MTSGSETRHRDVQVNVRLTEEEAAALTVAAERRKVTVATFLRTEALAHQGLSCGYDETHRHVVSDDECEFAPAAGLVVDPAEVEREALPDVETVAAAVHEAWMDSKRSQGITNRPSEWGEEQMVPYADLSERAKSLDRSTVQAVYDAIRQAGGAR